MRPRQMKEIVFSYINVKESIFMKPAIAVIVSAIAINLSLPVFANVNPNADVEVLSEAETHVVAAKGNFPAGYCTWYADQMIRIFWSGYKTGTTWQGNAKDWLNNAVAKGLSTSKTPSLYSIAVYGATTKNAYGHVAFVTAVDRLRGTYTIYEMNYTGFNKISTRTLANGSGGILGFITRPAK